MSGTSESGGQGRAPRGSLTEEQRKLRRLEQTRRSVYRHRAAREQIYLLVMAGQRARLHDIAQRRHGCASIQAYLAQVCDRMLAEDDASG